MTDSWSSASEVVCGKIIKGKLAVSAVRPELFIEPYNRIIELIQDGVTAREDLIARVGLSPITTCLEASQIADQGEHVDWIVLLETVAKKCLLADRLRRYAKKLDNGEDINELEVVEEFRQYNNNQAYMTPLTQIQEMENPFMPSGMGFIDQELGGWPVSGLITVGAPPKTGKTTLLCNAAVRFVRRYPDRKAGIFTLEMPGPEFKARVIKDLFPDITTDEMERIVISDGAGMKVAEVANRAVREPNLGFVGVDFADLMIQDDTSEPEMAKIYRTLANLAKTANIPVMLLSQLNRVYSGGVPLPRYLRWTGLAEALSWMLLMLYNPIKDFGNKTDAVTLTAIPGCAYVAAWMVRGGFVKHPEDNPGAIAVSFSGKKGWGDSSMGWYLLHSDG